MKTKIVSTRLTILSLNKISRYFNYSTTRQVIESILRLAENDNNLRQKMNEDIGQNSKKIVKCAILLEK